MNYSGNMPAWHQYNPPQSGINDVTSTAQNVNSGHMPFISSINPTCPTQLNGLNLSTGEGLEKHQNDPNFNHSRHFQHQPHLSGNISHGHNAADNNPLVQMQNCIGHYESISNTRNPMVDNLNGPMDPRNAAIGGMNEELGYRNNQVPLNGPISHLNGPNVMNMNASHASIGPRNTNVNSHAASRTAGQPPSFVPCKGYCCNPDSNMSYQQQWEKYCSYQNNATYRENIRTSTGYQTTDARRFGSEYNFRKDNFDGKEALSPMVPPSNGPNADHRRNFSDFKYRKDRMLSRGYPSASGMLQNYTMQNYNYAGEYQKYPYNVKDYSKMSGMNVPSQGMVKHPEQGFTMPQQKYNSKQVPYPQTGGVIMPNTNMPSTSVPNPNMMPSAQNTYFNSQYPRNLSTDASHDCQEVADNASMVNRMQQTATMHAPSAHMRYQMQQQKMAMQRFSMENHLRELERTIPGYQSHPKYKEYFHRYREMVKMQQSAYQGPIQQTPCVATSTTAVNTSTIPPINLQFDQNGVLINSNYMPAAFPRVQQTGQVNSQAAPVDSPVDKQGKQDGNGVLEMASRNVQKPEQLVSQQHDGRHATALCAESMQKQDRYPAQKSLDQNQYEAQKAGGESFNNLAGNASNAAVMQQKMSKEFADKPELDVRQFLANWDESEDEDGAAAGLPGAVLSGSTPVVVVGYENVDLSAKTLAGLEVSKPEAIAPGVIAFENREKSDVGVVPAQDCLTISYSTAENVEIAKDPACKDIAKEAIVRPGSHIIQCISNGPDEVPTIHIVDNLEIGSILQVTNGEVTETLGRQDAVSFFQEGTEVAAATITLEADKFKKTDDSATEPTASTEYNGNDLGNLSNVVEGDPAPPKTVESTPQTSRVSDQVIAVLPTSAKDSARDANLKKQSSFASEESHNPDDISLPDLPTSECTPISTTLNTPIHSDNEESSEHVEDLTIPTNPIEIMQNSPVISFTQSPTKAEPYDHLNGEGNVRNKPADSLDRNEYRTENRFKNNDNNLLGHDAILNTFEFSASADKNGSVTSAKSDKERANLNGASASANSSEKIFVPDNGTETVEATASMRMTLTSGEYELKIVSTGAQNKTVQAYKNLMSDRRANESQAAANPDAHKKSQAETNAKAASRYDDSAKIDNASQNVTNNFDPVELNDGQDDVNYSGRRCVSSTEMTRQTLTSRASSSPTNNVAPRSSRAAEDSCVTQVVKGNSPASHGARHLGGEKLRKSKASPFANEDSAAEKSAAGGNRPARIDATDPKSSRHARHADHRKSVSSDQAISRKKRYLSENAVERCGETIVHHNKHTQDAATHKDRSCNENPEGSDGAPNKPRVIENVSIADSAERMRLLKEYRRIKYKSLGVSDVRDKGKDAQEATDYAANKKFHRSSNPDERAASPGDNQLCQKDVTRSKSSEEQDGKRANILKTFVTKNMNPDFAIQVTNVNLKLKDDDHQKGSQHSREETKSGGSLDGIKIEINVSCTERNTTEKLLHENIKNAVAETIGHLTSSISNGARSNSMSITEIQCDKKMICDKADRRDYEKRSSRSPSAGPEVPAYNEAHEDHDGALKSAPACEDDTNGEALVSKKRRSSLSEQKLISDVYEDSGNVNTESELASSGLKTSRSEHATVRRRSVQDAERKVAATSLCDEELKASSDNSPYLGAKSVIVPKKEHQETAVASSCRSAKNFEDDAASKLNVIPSTSSGTVEPSMEDANYDHLVHLDYNHFDVAPNENKDTGDRRADRWKRPKRDDGRFGNFDLYGNSSGYVNPTFFSADELENRNTVPVYTTKDGKITYSPNPRTYRELLVEARAKDDYDNQARESYFPRSPSYDYYNCSKLRKVFKRNRDVTGRKREIEPVEAKAAAKHGDLPNNNAVHKNANCAKTRDTSHLEFFNDDKLYANKSEQKSKEVSKRNIVDLDFLEKQYNPDNESATVIKHCKTKVLAENLEYEKGYNESSVFESNLFLEPRAACWEETMESVKSYSSHIDRRNCGKRELNFSEIFAAQKRELDPFPLLPAEQDTFDSGNRKTNCDVTNEPASCHATTCNYIDDLRSIRNDDSRVEQSDAALCNRQENESAEISDKPVSIFDASLNMQSNDEQKQESRQFDGNESDNPAIKLDERARPCSPKITDEKIHDLEEDQCSTSYVKDQEALTEHPVEDDSHLHCAVSPEKDKSDAEVANPKEISDEDPAKVASPKLNVESTDSPNEPKNTETAKESALATIERGDEIDDSAKGDSDCAVNQEIVYQQQISSATIDHKDREETAPATESNVLAEINFDPTDEQDACDREDPATSKEDEPSALQDPPDAVFVEQTLDGERNEQQSEIPRNDKQKAEISLKDQEVDEVDTCSTIISTPAVAALDLQTENVCDLFACERREQNISEFTVIKSIIKGDKKQCQEAETSETPRDCGSIIDTKLLCMDSTDCGIYPEDRCALVQMSEHDFTEDDSMVPMVWETSQIQEDAVNRLCSIDESSIDFAGAVNSLQDNSLLGHLSLPRMSATKEPQVAEVTNEIESKAIDEFAPAVESAPAAAIEESKATPSHDESKEQISEHSQISSGGFEKIAYLRATDCNANTKIVPKLVIKKSETSSKFITKVGVSCVTQDSVANKSICQPKIPKMIIRNARSRPGTPSIEAVHEETSVQTSISDRALLTNEDLCESISESSLHESNSYRNKIPKMKIKLDEKHSNKRMRADDDEEICVKRKNVKKTIPKVKIKSTSRSDLADNSVCSSIISQDSRDSARYEEKIPILKLRKQKRNRSSSPEVTRKRQSSSYSDAAPVKKCRRSERDETEHHTRRSNSSDSTRTNASECETKKNSLMCISEKIPKVIIKRSSASAEFKCELSKCYKNVIAKSAKWQPEVKLERYRILDSMVKDLKLTLSPITLRALDKISASRRDGHRQEKQGDYKLSRSNSTSDLLPAKYKQRRMSDYDCSRKANDASKVDVNFAPSPDTDSRDAIKTCTTPKRNALSRSNKSAIDECQKDNKRRSRSRDNNPRSEAESDREINRSSERINSQKATSQCDKPKTDGFDIDREQAAKTDEDTISGKKNTPVKHPSSPSFKLALKELKAISKIETCFVKLPGPSETSSEEVNLQADKRKDDEPFLSKGDSKIVIKKKLLSTSSDMDNDCTLQDETDLLKDDSASMLDNFENSTVIKVESSDDSQSTIEILPASPDDNRSELERHMAEDGDSEQLYSADAIPTQFELELEIADNSNTDLLDASMPKLDPIVCYNSNRVTEESSDQIATAESCDKSDASSRDKNSLEKDMSFVEIDINNSDDRSALENGSAGTVREISLKAPCYKATGIAATRENFCCNDSLIKEVLAAKETLKKCLSKSKYDVQGNARPKTAAQKKQGSSFDINRFSEAPPSSVASQGCHSDVAPQTGFASAANKSDKTENISNIEKSEKKHSKSSKSSFTRKKPDENEGDSKEAAKNAFECNMISLKTFKQLDQAAPNENRTVHLNEKRKSLTGRSDDVPHSQDPHRKEKNRVSSYKIPKMSRVTHEGNDTSNAKEIKPKEDNMPILEPEVDVNFDTNSDRESSRSPPVITIQDSEDLGIEESKLVDDKIITSSIKNESNTKNVKESEMSIVDLITQLAYHEKATIKHRRYCNLCERWFPTTSRHRRHLTGYQHRHIELTQRRSIHALFTLFTGKPCPRLVSANVVRNDCSVGELTPLQIAVQDVTKCFDHTQQSPRKENNVDK